LIFFLFFFFKTKKGVDVYKPQNAEIENCRPPKNILDFPVTLFPENISNGNLISDPESSIEHP